MQLSKMLALKKNNAFSILFGLFLSFNAYGQSTINGTVKDQTGDLLIGANVTVDGTLNGTVTDIEGRFSLPISTSFPILLKVSYTGFEDQKVLKEGLILEEIVISASRKREKVQEAPASVSVLSTAVLSISPNVNPLENLANVRGVQIQQQSANRLNIEMRGWANIFSTSVFPILDYRNLMVPGLPVFASSGAGISNIDLRRIEVVRGPGSALYGPGVTSGVVHFLSKNPISFPGTSIELFGGELNTFGGAIRHATKVNDRFGFKVNVSYKQGDEFNYDMSDPEDAAIIQGFDMKDVVVSPFIDELGLLVQPTYSPNGELVNLNGGTLIAERLDSDGDGNPMVNDYHNFSINTTFEFRPREDWSVFATAGYNNFDLLLHQSTTGPQIVYRQDAFVQLRSQYKGLFTQVVYNTNRGDANGNESHVYQTGLLNSTDRKFLDAQLQYNFQVPSFLDADFTIGADYRNVNTDSKNLLNGRFEQDDDYNLWGTYAQGKFALAEQLDIVLAARLDGNNFIDQTTIAPRIAMVFKAHKNHTIRASFNRASKPPNSLEMYIDIPIRDLGFGSIWATQAREGTTFDHINLITPGAPNIPIDTPGLPVPLAAVYGQINNNAIALLSQNPNIPQPVLNYLSDYSPTGQVLGNLVAHDIGTLNLLDPTNFQFTSLMADNVTRLGQPTTITPIKNEFNNVYEIGYSGEINNKLKIDIDLYYLKREGFTRPKVVGALYGLDGVGTALAQDVAQQLVLNLGLTPEQAAPIAAAYGGLGNAAVAVYGVADGDQVPQDPSFNVPFTWQSFDESIDYFGADLGLTYRFKLGLAAFFNYSFISQNSWIPGEEDDDGLTEAFYINTPENKFRMGLRYIRETGFNGSISFRHTPSFNFVSGVYYNGQTDEQNIVDLSLGYRFDHRLKGFAVSLSATNLFDSKYRAAPDFPNIGRRGLIKLNYIFGMN